MTTQENRPEQDQDILPEKRFEAERLLNQAVDHVNDLVTTGDEIINKARSAFMISTCGTDVHSEEFTEEEDRRWFDALSNFYTNLFIRAAAIQYPIETEIAKGLPPIQKVAA